MSGRSLSSPRCFSEPPEGAACFGPVVDLSVDGDVTGEGAAQAGEGLYCLEGLSVHLYLWLVVLELAGTSPWFSWC